MTVTVIVTLITDTDTNLREEIRRVENVNSGDGTSFVRPAEYFMHAEEGI